MNEDKSIKMAHAVEMAEAVAETNLEHARLTHQIMDVLDPGSKVYNRTKEEVEANPLYRHFKTSWLLNPEAFTEALKTNSVKACKHIDYLNPSPMFYLPGAGEKALLCSTCSSELMELLVKENPDKCDLCNTAPHKIFHEIMITTGLVHIAGNVCTSCSETYMRK